MKMKKMTLLLLRHVLIGCLLFTTLTACNHRASFSNRFLVTNPTTGKTIPNLDYYIEVGDKVYWGKTDKEGLTPRFYTNKSQEISAWYGYEALMKIEAMNEAAEEEIEEEFEQPTEEKDS